MKRWRWLPFLLSYLWPQKIRISKGVKKIWILEVVFFFRYEWRELPHRDVRDWIIKLSIFVQFIKVELWAHRAKTSTVISSFYCSFVMFYICLTFVPSLKKNVDSTSFSKEWPWTNGNSFYAVVWFCLLLVCPTAGFQCHATQNRSK